MLAGKLTLTTYEIFFFHNTFFLEILLVTLICTKNAEINGSKLKKCPWFDFYSQFFFCLYG